MNYNALANLISKTTSSQPQFFTSQFPTLNLLYNLSALKSPRSLNLERFFIVSPMKEPVNELPYPVEVIDDMVQCFFENRSFWPINFIHPRTFITKRYHIPRPLLAAICARGSEFSKYNPILKLRGEDAAEKLFNYAMESYDVSEISMESLITTIQLAFHASSRNNTRTLQLFSSVIQLLMIQLNIYTDPDIIEKENSFKVKFTIVEKEVRRRIFAAIKLIGHGTDRNMFVGLPFPSLKRPLPNHIFEALSEDSSDISEVVYSTEVVGGYAAETNRFELQFWNLRKRTSYLYQSITHFSWKDLDLMRVMIEVLKIHTELKEWLSMQPQWFLSSHLSTNIHVGWNEPHDPSKIPWLTPTLMISFRALELALYRIAIVLLFLRNSDNKNSSFVEKLESVDKSAVDAFIHVAINDSWNAHKFFMDALKNCIIRNDPEQQYIYPILVFTTIQAAVFASSMTSFGKTAEEREIAARDFALLKQFFSNVGKTTWKLANTVLSDVERFDKLPFGDTKVELLLNLWTGGGYGCNEQRIMELGLLNK
ncbi:hypothetical protein HK098_006737 [Nowakowskiella sp. JEL0407]|nr:hypothetical protein HK098_006737 [Nowakowskiella sp. JEL0407]